MDGFCMEKIKKQENVTNRYYQRFYSQTKKATIDEEDMDGWRQR